MGISYKRRIIRFGKRCFRVIDVLKRNGCRLTNQQIDRCCCAVSDDIAVQLKHRALLRLNEIVVIRTSCQIIIRFSRSNANPNILIRGKTGSWNTNRSTIYYGSSRIVRRIGITQSAYIRAIILCLRQIRQCRSRINMIERLPNKCRLQFINCYSKIVCAGVILIRLCLCSTNCENAGFGSRKSTSTNCRKRFIVTRHRVSDFTISGFRCQQR